MYRPHFCYHTPENCIDQPYEYYFDPSDVPAEEIASNGDIFGMILGPLDKDAPFHWRGWRIFYNGADPALEILFRDPDGQALSDDTINLLLYAVGSGFSTNLARGGMQVAMDEEIICPPGAVIEVNWRRAINTSGTVPPFPGITLSGVKRYSGVRGL